MLRAESSAIQGFRACDPSKSEKYGVPSASEGSLGLCLGFRPR